MKTLGTAFAILLGGAMTTGMFMVGVVCGVALSLKMEEKDKKKDYPHWSSYDISDLLSTIAKKESE